MRYECHIKVARVPYKVASAMWHLKVELKHFKMTLIKVTWLNIL